MGLKFDPKLTWNSLTDDCINDFYRPALENCILYQRTAGYFSSSAFAHVANEILEFIEAKGKMQLIASPQLSAIDKKIFEESILEREKVLEKILLEDLKNDSANLKLEFSKLMAYMLANKIDGKPQLEIKIALPVRGPGMYHQKIGIMHYNNGERIAFSGSINETGMAWYDNKENFHVFRSWGDGTNDQGVVDNQRIFNNLWNGSDKEVVVFDLPKAVHEDLLKIRPKSDEEMKETLEKVKKIIRDKTKKVEQDVIQYKRPIELFEHQNAAITKWVENNFCGLLEMATGTGKTYTAFGCINKLQKLHQRTAIIIACPQKHLVEQWKKELEKYNSGVEDSEKVVMEKTVTCDSDYPKWRYEFAEILYNCNIPPIGSSTYITNNIVIFTTHDTLATENFTQKVLEIKDAKKFLIVDEVHNITSDTAPKTLLEDYEYRLGLSATPTRHMDDEGTNILLTYFHSNNCKEANLSTAEFCNKCHKPLIVYKLDLKTAIHQLHVLCPYHYYPYYVELTSEEMDIYNDLTAKIAQAEEKKKKGKPLTEIDKYPYLARANLVANAEKKDIMLDDILSLEFNNRLHLALIYCTNNPRAEAPQGVPKQLERVKNILFSKGIKSDSVTYEDKTEYRKDILSLLEGGVFDCITAVRCLDEGVDVPAVETGIFMASSGNPKQFVQRRGRILRKNEITNKQLAKIYDILVSPPSPDLGVVISLNERKLIAKELLRHKEFAEIANNKDEAFRRIRDVADKFNINLELLDYDYINNLN